VKLTADLIVTENKAKVQEAILTLLATVYTANTYGTKNAAGKYVTLAPAGSQARAVQDAFNTKEDDRLALGVGSDELVSGTPAAAASFFGKKSDMTTLADKFNAETLTDAVVANRFTAAKKVETLKATLLTKAYF
jgi:hypothetical protein